MTITVTNTSAQLNTLMSGAQLALAESNRSGALFYKITLYNADSTSTDILRVAIGETAVATSVPLFAPLGATVPGDTFITVTGDLTKINLISNVASTTLELMVEPYWR